MINPPPGAAGQLAAPQNPVTPELYPAMQYAAAPISPDKVPTSVYTRSLALSADGEREVLRACNTFKINTLMHAKQRKLNQERNYAYLNSQFFGDDLLPLPSGDEDNRDANSSRPQIFIPVTAEQLLQIYAFVCTRIFPNDEDYFRVVAKKEEFAAYEDALTDALKYLFKKNKVSEQIKRCIMNTLWSGQFVAFPRFEIPKGWEWMPPDTPDGDFSLQPTLLEPRLIVDEINPIHLYLDPLTSTNPRWMTLGYKKIQEILDSPFTIQSTISRLKNCGSKSQPLTSQYQEGLPVAVYNQVNTNFVDDEKWAPFDTFYFPYLKADGKMFYNLTVVMVDNQIITEFRPNVAFGESQLVQTAWRHQTESNYGFAPADDMQNLQIIINMVYNFMLEWMSRNGNVWGVMEGVDLKQLFGGVARILVTPAGIPPREAIESIEADPRVLEMAINLAGVLRGFMVNVGGSQDPFQGSANLDFKKTATEINVLESNAVSRVQESTEHIGNCGVAPVLEKLAFMAAHLYQGPITVRIDNPQAAPIIPGEQPGPQDVQLAQAQQAQAQGQALPPPTGPFFREIDLSVLQSGEFTIELTGLNAAQAKAATDQLAMNLLQLTTSNPQGAIMSEAILEKIAIDNGWKDFPEVFGTFKQRYEQMMQAEAAAKQAQTAEQMATKAGDKATMQRGQSQ